MILLIMMPTHAMHGIFLDHVFTFIFSAEATSSGVSELSIVLLLDVSLPIMFFIGDLLAHLFGPDARFDD